MSCRLKGEGGEEREGEKERAGADGGTFLCSFPHLDDDEAAKKSRRKSGGEAKVSIHPLSFHPRAEEKNI